MEKPPLFTRDYLLVCAASFLSGSAQYLVITALPLLLKTMGFGDEFVGGYVGAFALGALLARFPVGGAVDRFGARIFGWGGAGMLSAGCALYALMPFVPLSLPLVAGIPLLLPVAGIAHSFGFSTYGTAANSFVAYTVPQERRGEAIAYFGILTNVAVGGAAGISLLIVHAWGFTVLLGIAASIALLAAILSSNLCNTPRAADSGAFGSVLFEKSVLVPGLASTMLAAGNGVAIAFVPLHGLERGIVDPGFYFTVVALTSITFRVLSGRFVDALGRTASIVPGMLFTAAGLFLVGRANSMETLALAGFVYGVGSATAIPSLQALAIDVAGPGRRGAAMATFWATVDLGVSMGSTAAGRIAATSGYSGAFTAASFAPLAGLLLFLVYKWLRRLPSQLPSKHY